MIEDIVTLYVIWGSYDHNRNWIPNPLLEISADEQYRLNQETIAAQKNEVKNGI